MSKKIYIYGAAHVFGVKKDDVSICNWGELSMLSFHATKVFNTFEGGALVTNDENLKTRIDFLKNFGFANEVTVVAPGSNGKMDEFCSAFGLLQLDRVDGEIAKRQKVAQYYRENLQGVPGIRMLYDIPGVHHNYAYFPILIDAKDYGMTRDALYDIPGGHHNYTYFPILVNAKDYGMSRDALYDKLKAENIFSRRYFYPLCSDFPTYRGLPSAAPARLPVATKVSQEVLCLPMYADLSPEDLERVVAVLKNSHK